MLTYLQRLTDERDSLTASATSITDQAAADGRDLSDTETASIATMSTRCAEIDAQLTTYGQQVDSTRAYAALRSRLREQTTPDDPPSEPGTAVATRAAAPEPSWGEIVERSGLLGEYTGGRSRAIEVGSALETRAAIDTTAGPYPPALVAAPAVPSWPNTLSGLVLTVRTSSGSIAWVYATPQPPDDAPVVAEGALKPEMNLTLTVQEKTLSTYAHFKAITRQALDDIPQIRALVESYLRSGLTTAIEGGIVAALGADANIPAVVRPLGDTLLQAIREGMATVQTNGFNPNGVVLHPSDWADIDLAVLTGTVIGPVSNNQVFGLRIAASSRLAAGTAYVGDFREGVTLFDRGVTNVYLTDSHADFFLRNQLVLLGETRALPVVTTPTALAKCSVSPVVE
jgi:HK97 family phage major capsid protein